MRIRRERANRFTAKGFFGSLTANGVTALCIRCRFQIGVAMMAIKTGVAVYPAYLDGTQRGKEMVEAVLTPNHARLIFGPPVEFDRGSTAPEALAAATCRSRRPNTWSPRCRCTTRG